VFGSFPPEYIDASIRRQLVPGTIIKFNAIMDDGKLQEKRFIILDVSGDTFTCVINSKINSFIAKNAKLLQCQVEIKKQQHPFMDWDSHIDCTRVRTYSTDNVVEQLKGVPTWILGCADNNLIDQIMAALKLSPSLSPLEVQRYCGILGAVQISRTVALANQTGKA